ncbi:MAG: thiamine phosphate synthase [Eubacteriales bacterium]|nr:thiamine phosphate synthase [Eubacteriales bacterium]
MKLKKEHCVLYAVTDRKWSEGTTLARQVEAALRGGVTMVQLREKELSGEALEKEALEIQKLCRAYGVPFLINDNVALAEKIGADGVHVGQNDMEAGAVRALLGPDKIIGVTAKTVEQAQAAEEAGADYLGSGAVFGSATKADAISMDPDLLDRICDSVKIPVVAIGGIHAGNVARLKGRKISGVAVVSGIFANPDIEKGTRALKSLVMETIPKS